MTIKKDMKKELEKYKDSVYYLNKSGKLIKTRIDTLDDYNHSECNLHHYILFKQYEKNKEWYETRGIKQKLILVSQTLHEDIHDIGIRILTDEEFKDKYKISRWELLFNRKYSRY